MLRTVSAGQYPRLVKNAASGVAMPRSATASTSTRVGVREETYAPRQPTRANATMAQVARAMGVPTIYAGKSSETKIRSARGSIRNRAGVKPARSPSTLICWRGRVLMEILGVSIANASGSRVC